MKKHYTSQDFDECFSDNELERLPFHSGDLRIRSQTDVFAEMANKKLPALIEAEIQRRLSEAETVWLCVAELKTAHLAQPVDATHKAKLLAITPIDKPWPWEKNEKEIAQLKEKLGVAREALRKAVLWGECVSAKTAVPANEINWRYLNEAREALAAIKENGSDRSSEPSSV